MLNLGTMTPRRRPRPELQEWECPACGTINAKHRANCLGELGELNPITGKPKTCGLMRPGRPKPPNWRSQLSNV